MTVKRQIITILNSSETRRVRFSFTGEDGSTVNVEPTMFRSVANAIENDQIAIVENWSTADIAMYSARADPNNNVAANTLYLGRNQRSSRLFNALIVHEAVHAAWDIARHSLRWIDNEAAGYIAQAYYARNSGLPRTAYLYGSHAILAFSIVQGMRDSNDSDVSFFLSRLRENLRNDPLYNTYINGQFDGDGV